MRILGLDPGIARTGFGVLEVNGGTLRHVAHGCLTTPAGTPQAERLAALAEAIRAMLREHQPELAAVEKLFFTKNTTTAMNVGEARGIALAECAAAGIPLVEYTPSAVKSAVAAHGRADKQQMQTMVKLLLQLPSVPTPDDAADALAVAVTAAAHLNAPR